MTKLGFMQAKAMSPILAGVLFTAIILASVSIMLSGVLPSINEMRDTAVLDAARNTLSDLDRTIQQVASEGRGSQRVISLTFTKGGLTVSPSAEGLGAVIYEVETLSGSVSAGASTTIGNMRIAAGSGVNVTASPDTYLLKNEHLSVNISRAGNASSWQPVNVSELLGSVRQEDNNVTIGGYFSFVLDSDESKGAGTGYTTADEGEGLGSGRVTAYVNTSAGLYNVFFTLKSGADHLVVEVRNALADNVTARITDPFINSSETGAGSNDASAVKNQTILSLVSPIASATAAANDTVSMAVPYDGNKIYIVLTPGNRNSVLVRLPSVIDGSFDQMFNAAFGFPVPDKTTVTITLSYDNINITSSEKLAPGRHELVVRNDGPAGGAVGVTITRA